MSEFLLKKFWLIYFSLISFTLISACATMGVPSPETFNEKLAVGYGTVTQIRTTTAQLVTSKKLGSVDAQNIQGQADNARAGLDIARDLSKSDLPAANNRLQMATTILTALQSYLSTRQTAAQ